MNKIMYLAGPMTGLEGLNKDEFHAAACFYRAQGLGVINPAEIDDDGVDYETLVRIGEFHATVCDVIALLPGWERSVGARREVRAACRGDNSKTLLEVEGLLGHLLIRKYSRRTEASETALGFCNLIGEELEVAASCQLPVASCQQGNRDRNWYANTGFQPKFKR